MNKQKSSNAFDGADSGLSAGIDALFTDTGPQYSLIYLDMIEVNTQVREVFESDENTLADLAANIKERGVLQPVVLRQTSTGYALVAGERRFRASKLAGLEQIPAMIHTMTDEEAEDAQFAENIHRLNLRMIEEAKKVQKDLDELKDIDKVLVKHNKGRAWLSKILSLLTLPEQAKRLITENISADIEVINTVKTIEKIDPVAAANLVDDLKETRGKENARDKSNQVKAGVKPKPTREKKPPEIKDSGKADNFAGAKIEDDNTRAIESVLNAAYFAIYGREEAPKKVLSSLSPVDKELVETYLNAFYDAGAQSKNVGQAVIKGLRDGHFSCDGGGALALASFLQGVDSEAKFSLLNIFGSVKE